MSFKSEKVIELHKMSGEKSKDFARAIFGPKSKLGPEYFNGRDSISTHHLELLCEHYHVPITFFFDDTPLTVVNQIGTLVKNNDFGVGTVNINNDVAHLQETIKHLESVIKDKDGQIKWLKSQWDAMLKTFQNLGK